MMIGWTYRITFGSTFTPTMGATMSNFWSGGGEATCWSGGSDMRIRLQVDNEYDLYMTESGDGPWLYIGGGNSWYKMGDITIPNWTGSKKLKMWSRNYTGPAALIGHVDYLGETYKTGTA